MLIPESRQATKNRAGRRSVILAVCLMTLLITSIALAQAKKPISKKGLVEAISLNGLTTKELVEQVQTRGVNFQMTAADEEDFRAAGARPELIAAIKENYRSAVPVSNTTPSNSGNTRPPTNSSGSSKPPANVPNGPPLAKTEVITMLQSGVTADRVQQFIEVRGVTFSITPAISREIIAAGGNQALVNAISSRGTSTSNDSNRETFKGGTLGVQVAEVTSEIASQFGLADLGGAFVDQVEKGTSAERAGLRRGDVIVEFNNQVVNATTLPVLVSKAPGKSQAVLSVIRNRRRQQIRLILGEQLQFIGPDYDDLVDQATGAIRGKDPNGAINLLQKAIQLNPDQPTAYNLMAYAQLYGMQDITSAESSMRSAIDRGGNAIFRVYHDHGGSFSQNCVGSLFISKEGVSYKADDGVHALEATRAEITDTKGPSGQNGAFEIRATQSGKKNTYKFAPNTRKQAEAQLILKLIQSYR